MYLQKMKERRISALWTGTDEGADADNIVPEANDGASTVVSDASDSTTDSQTVTPHI